MKFYLLDVADIIPLLELGESNDWESVTCTLRPGHQRAGKRVTPLCISLGRGKIADFNTTMMSDIIVTDRVKNALTSSELSGAKFSHVLVEKSLLRTPPVLWELTVDGGRVRLSKNSGVKLFYECRACGHKVFTSHTHGLLIDESTYSDADFFTSVEYPKHFLTSERAAQFLTESAFTGLVMTPVSEVHWPKSITRTEKDAGNIYEKRKLEALTGQ